MTDCGWGEATALEMLLQACEHTPRIERQVAKEIAAEIETELGPPEDDGQPTEQKEHEDFAKDDDLSNRGADEIQ